MLLAMSVADPSLAEDESDTWDLGHIYPSVEAWSEAKDALEARLPEIDACKGHLGDSSEKLLECSEMLSGMFKEWARISSYASMASDADTRDADNQQRLTEVRIMGSQFGEKLSFLSPEIVAIGEETLRSYLDEQDGLEPHRLNLLDTLRQAEHVLSPEAEQMMAATSLIRSTPQNTYSTLANADMPWPTITLSDGEEARLDQSGYSKYRSADKREDRKAVFDAFWGKWKEFERTMGTTLSGQVNAHVFTHRQLPQLAGCGAR
jgi:oligoendopeptidase F